MGDWPPKGHLMQNPLTGDKDVNVWRLHAYGQQSPSVAVTEANQFTHIDAPAIGCVGDML